VTVKRPPNVYGKPLANGKTLWSWQPSSKDRKKDCPLKYRALGSDPLEAFKIADELNDALKDWRNGVQSVAYLPGSFGWLLMEFLAHKDVKSLSKTAQAEYERHAKYMMAVREDGNPVEKKMLSTFSAMFAYKFYNRLSDKHSVGIANRCLMLARYAWNKMYVLHERQIPATNPFDKIKPAFCETEETIPATYGELTSFISAALAMGEIGIAIGARLCWDMHIRPSEVFGSVLREHWRPANMQSCLWVGVDKTSKGKRSKASAWQPLDDLNPDTGQWECMFPELESLIRMAPYSGGHLCMRERRAATRVFEGEWQPIQNYVSIIKRIRRKIGLGDHVTFEAFRHGGLTELGDAGVPDTLARARSLHKQRSTLDRYIHRTNDQSVAAQRMRLEFRNKE